MLSHNTTPNLRGLETSALLHGGYFDRRSALAHGLSDALLSYHTRTGRFERVLLGVYRLASAPVSSMDEYFLAWLWTNRRGAISHESALALYGLGDVVPSRVHVTVPRDVSRVSPPFIMHRARLEPDDVQMCRDIQVTTPERSIVDAAATGSDPTQIRKAVREAVERALTTPARLRSMALTTGYRKERKRVQSILEAELTNAR